MGGQVPMGGGSEKNGGINSGENIYYTITLLFFSRKATFTFTFQKNVNSLILNSSIRD